MRKHGYAKSANGQSKPSLQRRRQPTPSAWRPSNSPRCCRTTERNALLEAEQKATRDARYAARKAAKKQRRRGHRPNPHIGERTKLTTCQERIDDFIHEGSPPNDQPLQILCEDHVGTYVILFPCRWRDGIWENAKTSRSIEATVVGWRLWTKLSAELSGFRLTFCLGLSFLVFDDLSLVETAEAGSFDCRDVDKYIFAAALFASCGLESQNGSPDRCPVSFLRTHDHDSAGQNPPHWPSAYANSHSGEYGIEIADAQAKLDAY